jgi:hypothetical protein
MNTMSKELEDLKARNEELEVRIAMLENQLNPKPLPPSNRGPVDYTAGFSMPRNAMQAMADAIPSSVMRGIAEDARRPSAAEGLDYAQKLTEDKRR